MKEKATLKSTFEILVLCIAMLVSITLDEKKTKPKPFYFKKKKSL